MRRFAAITFCLSFLLLSALFSAEARALHSQSAAPSVEADPGEPARGKETVEPAASPGWPLPEIAALMREVEANQRKLETVEKTYLYHSVERMQELGTRGEVKKTSVKEADHFWLHGVPVQKVTRRDGKDLTATELAKEDERIDKETLKERDRRERKDAEGKETDPQGHDEVSVSRLLELGTFTNVRRIDLGGRPTIAVDYAGDPHGRTHNRAEEVMKDLAGTAWIDETDKVVVRIEGQFQRDFKIGGGLLADVRKGTHFAFHQARINDEVWLPAGIDAQGVARAMLFFNFAGHIDVAYSDYRKFRATATVLPDVTPVSGAAPQGEAAPQP